MFLNIGLQRLLIVVLAFRGDGFIARTAVTVKTGATMVFIA